MAADQVPTRKPSIEDKAAKIVNIVMVSAIGLTALVFTLWEIFHHAALLFHTRGAEHDHHLEMLTSAAIFGPAIVFAAIGLLRKR